ncbi:MAG: rhomboid family intramembrane serine protease [Clostridiales bacterium]|nr:rhomboid family intramembrane serine protease [Clostridiales bacterium]
MSDNKTKSPATNTLIAINVLIFLYIYANGGINSYEALVKYGAKINSLIVGGEYWRFFSSAFLHANLAHIAFNMYSLYNIGKLDESIFGSKKFIIIYFFSALSGSIFSFVFSNSPSIGASGAIFGLLGAVLYLCRKYPRILTSSFGINILVIIGLNIFYGLSNPQIDNFAHIGGLIGGYMSANITGLKGDDRIDSKKLLFTAASILLVICGTIIGIKINS